MLIQTADFRTRSARSAIAETRVVFCDGLRVRSSDGSSTLLQTMAKTFKSVSEYIATHPKRVQTILRRIRSTIRKAMPGAEEMISYQIPTYQLPSGVRLFFAGWKQHYSIYPASPRMVAAFKQDLAPYKISKGTIRFPLSEPIPVRLIERIAKFRAKEAASKKR
jgi:uncharacterized protein YdhG (YjbR/CyaY superfamily)